MTKLMSKEQQQVNPYPIRLTAELKEKLKDSAKTNGRSLNAEMLIRLDASFNINTEQHFIDSIDIDKPNTEKVLKKLIEEILDKREESKNK